MKGFNIRKIGEQQDQPKVISFCRGENAEWISRLNYHKLHEGVLLYFQYHFSAEPNVINASTALVYGFNDCFSECCLLFENRIHCVLPRGIRISATQFKGKSISCAINVYCAVFTKNDDCLMLKVPNKTLGEGGDDFFIKY